MTDTTANNSSERSVCLTIAERYAAIKHAYGLTCTTAARLLINEFVEKLQLDDEEKKTYHQKNEVLKHGIPLLDRKTDSALVNRLIASYI